MNDDWGKPDPEGCTYLVLVVVFWLVLVFIIWLTH